MMLEFLGALAGWGCFRLLDGWMSRLFSRFQPRLAFSRLGYGYGVPGAVPGKVDALNHKWSFSGSFFSAHS